MSIPVHAVRNCVSQRGYKPVKKISASLFVAVIFAFSAFLAILSLFASIKLAALGDEAVRIEKNSESLRTENELLAAQVEGIISLENLERYALEVLGMQRCTPEQIEYLEINEAVG